MNYIIIDIEATCDSERDFPMETIEIGAVKVNSDNKMDGTFQEYIKPATSHVTKFCTELTSIKPSDVKNARSFKEVMEDFVKFCGKDFIVCSWGDYDKRQLEKDCSVNDVNPDFLKKHINIKEMYSEVTGIRAKGLIKATRAMGFEFVGFHHRALPDAIATANIFTRLQKINDGYVYCTSCTRGKFLISAIADGVRAPKKCMDCYPFNPEEGYPMELRINYKKRN